MFPGRPRQRFAARLPILEPKALPLAEGFWRPYFGGEKRPNGRATGNADSDIFRQQLLAGANAKQDPPKRISSTQPGGRLLPLFCLAPRRNFRSMSNFAGLAVGFF
jgi:hypothetical protein